MYKIDKIKIDDADVGELELKNATFDINSVIVELVFEVRGQKYSRHFMYEASKLDLENLNAKDLTLNLKELSGAVEL